jgi:hypothetical protein
VSTQIQIFLNYPHIYIYTHTQRERCDPPPLTHTHTKVIITYFGHYPFSNIGLQKLDVSINILGNHVPEKVEVKKVVSVLSY